jgi:hypothetical protein
MNAHSIEYGAVGVTGQPGSMIFALTWLSLTLALSPFAANAQSDQGLAECASVDDTLRRLACYDEYASSTGLEPPPVIAIPEAYANRTDDSPERAMDLPATGEWTTSTELDSDGVPTSVALSSWAVAGASTEGYAISMTVSCRRGRTTLSVHWEDYLGSWANISTRIGADEAGTRQWNLSIDNRSAIYPGRTLVLIGNLIEAGSASFRVKPYAKTEVIAEFDTSGLGAAFEPWREICRR